MLDPLLIDLNSTVDLKGSFPGKGIKMPGSRPSVTTPSGSSVSHPTCFTFPMVNRNITLSTLWLLLVLTTTVNGAELDDSRKLLISGKYSECIRQTAAAIKDRKWGEGWYVIKAEAEQIIGDYQASHLTVQTGLKRYSSSIRLRMTGRQACLLLGDSQQAEKYLHEIEQQVSNAPWRYTDVEDLVALGGAALVIGADARDVLDGFFDRARKRAPDHRLPYLAIGKLALDKHDSELAAKTFQKAIAQYPDDPDLFFGLAEAFASSDAQKSAISLAKTLELNPNHIPALLFKVDQFVDSEQYAAAHKWLDRIRSINPHHFELWAYRAVLAHLENDPKGEIAFRNAALMPWKNNPRVDHLIGKKLSQKYRFAEGAKYQRQALSIDMKYLPARIQLSQDLLRLGKEEEGWLLAEATHREDGYDVATFNLLELRDRIEQFRTLENDDFILRMEAREAAIYGDRVLSLLGKAKKTLCKKYGLELNDKVTVEIFPDENDFEVRTFGMPAVGGFLGVCFGKVITANSPASQGDHPSNWEAVLWHEFCHVVTLELTRNKMPRWLSEGISVYEELQADPRWGQRMTPLYREMILEGEATPLSELSSAFLAPKSPMHLQFAYYESALAVEFLIDRFSLEALKLILRDLGSGLPINVAIERHTDPLPKLDQNFSKFILKRAKQLAPETDWTKPDLEDLLNDDTDALAAWVKEHPNNFYGLTAYGNQLIENKEWAKAVDPLTKLVELYPGYTGSGNAYEMLAVVHRELKHPKQELAVLEQFIALEADAVYACLRIIELGTRQKNWELVERSAQHAVAVNPLLPQPYRGLTQAAEKTGKIEDAIAGYRALLVIGPADLADIHYRLALLFWKQNDPKAKRHVLSALEQAPRFRAAHKLLLEINREGNSLATKDKKRE
jgi:tetratricopeptide (TPR) repeat protein